MKKNSVLRYISQSSGRSAAGIVGLLIIQIMQAVASVSYALFLRNVINAAVAGDKAGFWQAIVRLALLFALQIILSALRRYLDAASRSQLENRFKARLFSALLKRDYACVSSMHSGEWMNRLTNDTVVVAGGLVDILPGLAGMLVKLIGAVVMIIVLEKRFLYLIVPGGVLLLVFSTLFRKQMKQLHKAIQERDGKLRMFMQEALENLIIVRSYAAEDDTLACGQEKMDEHRRARLRRNHFANAANTGFTIVMDGASVLGALFCGYGILTGTMDYGSFTAVLSLIAQVQTPFANISGYLPRYYAMLASAERLMEIENVTAEEEKKSLSLDKILSDYADGFEGFGLDNACFSYPVRSQQLSENMEREELSPLPEDISLYFRKGEYAAFTGASGCGKSTALKLLMCLYPLERGERYMIYKGQKLPLDGKWQKLFAYVPQGNQLMSGSVRQIVSYAEPSAAGDEERLKNALYTACAEFVYELENGVDTVLGERGTGLSEGQMQRIAIARAIFSKHPILMLDECTSALDEKTEARLLQNLRKMTDRTVLIVTHRAAALYICDQEIIISEQGCEQNRKLYN